MAVDTKLNEQLHKRLPIGAEEEILGVYRHHWFVYVSIWFIGFLLVVGIMSVAMLLTASVPNDLSNVSQYRPIALVGAGILSLLVAMSTLIPAWLKSQEQLVVTDEALLQILQPSLFGSKTSQLGLQHIADVSVRKDFFGTILGYGSLTIETPGEQANYTFNAVPNADEASKTIIEAHENFTAALESGRLPTTLNRSGMDNHSVQVNAADYQRFLDFQQFQAKAADTPQQPPAQEQPQPTQPVPPQDSGPQN